ncbi:MAG: DNA-3-methyladenine glycosylase 2 family protein [Comamonas sp.]|jgi:DNA-3-methyladenine glycosylase II|uniref:DNA-3-methyladenine glycosylase family protein n=1 Tax=Comamonas sp. TaxID=34028 RepID=UPI0028181BB7|nr:DNA-3-methyladenine glycosylase 2 family protein [Comamonas sp.]MDR0216842.1 DNA-3-methyladenine glycosylase 2 family protein [Comamonas sp.]
MSAAKHLDTMEYEQLPLVADLPVLVGPKAPLPVAPMGVVAYAEASAEMTKDAAPAKTAAAAKPATPKVPLTLPEGVPAYWAEACRQLMRRDRVLKRLIPLLSSQALLPREQCRDEAFATLARSIVGQQIAVKSAKTLWNKFSKLLAEMQPELVLKLKVDDMRAAGLSARKVDYLVDLALHFTENRLRMDEWAQMGDDAIIAELMAIRGLSRWTAENFLIYYLARPNVLPLDDAGLIQGISLNYFSGDPVSRSDAREVAEAWKPWCTVATWYIWRSLEAQPVAG